jgi:hypothetical protein
MLSRITGLLIAAMSVALLTVSSPARAEIEYPWCAVYGGMGGNDGTNCGFVTRAQCMATISGIGGDCYVNPRYQGAASRPAKPRVTGQAPR